MSFLENRKVCFNQESLPITYHDFRHKNLVRPKNKYENWQISQPISYQTRFSQRDNIYLVDLKCNTTYQNVLGKLRLDQFLCPKKPQMAKMLPYNLNGWAFYKIVKFVLTKKVTNNLTQFPSQKSGQIKK